MSQLRFYELAGGVKFIGIIIKNCKFIDVCSIKQHENKISGLTQSLLTWMSFILIVVEYVTVCKYFHANAFGF